MQSQILEVSADLESVPKNIEALLFAVYLCAVVSLNNKDCENILGDSRSTLMEKYSSAAQQAVVNACFFKVPGPDDTTSVYSLPGKKFARSFLYITCALRTCLSPRTEHQVTNSLDESAISPPDPRSAYTVDSCRRGSSNWKEDGPSS